MFNEVAAHGFVNITDATSHLVDKDEHIYEFVKGDFRFYYFKDGGKVIICTECLRKKGQKANSSAVARSIAFKSEYKRSLVDKSLTRLLKPNQ